MSVVILVTFLVFAFWWWFHNTYDVRDDGYAIYVSKKPTKAELRDKHIAELEADLGMEWDKQFEPYMPKAQANIKGGVKHNPYNDKCRCAPCRELEFQRETMWRKAGLEARWMEEGDLPSVNESLEIAIKEAADRLRMLDSRPADRYDYYVDQMLDAVMVRKSSIPPMPRPAAPPEKFRR